MSQSWIESATGDDCVHEGQELAPSAVRQVVKKYVPELPSQST
jgi:hypothetical protein